MADGGRHHKPRDGKRGKSAYEIAVDQGYEGSEEAFARAIIRACECDSVEDAQQTLLTFGLQRSVEEIIALLRGEKGEKGDKGDKGDDGASAFEVAQAQGFSGSVIDWLESLKGEPGRDGEDGLSAYEIALRHGFRGTEDEWLESLKGEPGKDGRNATNQGGGPVRLPAASVILSDGGTLQDAIDEGEIGGGGGASNFADLGGDPYDNVALATALDAKEDAGAAAAVASDLADHEADHANPHGTTAAQVGLGSVDNTADHDKPVSTAQAAADATVAANAATDATAKANAAQAAAQSYADSLVTGLWDDRGTYDASGNVFPSSGGSGSAGAVLKGDLWTVSVAGTLGGHAVNVGDIVRALVNAPGQTDANWWIGEANLGYTAENSANKVTSISGASTDTQYPSAKLLYDQLALKQGLSATLTALAATAWAANAVPIGTGAGTLSQTAFAANKFPARGSSGNLVAKDISDDALTFVAAANFAAMRSALGTTVGAALMGLADPSAISFIRINADNTVTARSAANFRSDIGAGVGDAVLANDQTFTGQNTFAAGTITTSKPLAITQTWNAAGVAFKARTVTITSSASSSSSYFDEWTLNGTQQAALNKIGQFFSLGAQNQVAFGFAQDITTGIGYRTTSTFNAMCGGSETMRWLSTAVYAFQPIHLSSNVDASFMRVAANSVMWTGLTAGLAAGAVTSRTEMNKAVTAIADNTATAVFTITVPNAAHSASFRVRLVGSAGAGGAVGANESTQSAEYLVDVTRTAGKNAVATIGATVGQPAAATVAGGNAVAVSGSLGAVSGAVGASNTFTVQVTIARAGGAAANHTCLAYIQLLNANTTGITVA